MPSEKPVIIDVVLTHEDLRDPIWQLVTALGNVLDGHRGDIAIKGLVGITALLLVSGVDAGGLGSDAEQVANFTSLLVDGIAAMRRGDARESKKGVH